MATPALVFGWRTAVLALASAQMLLIAVPLLRMLPNRTANRCLGALLLVLLAAWTGYNAWDRFVTPLDYFGVLGLYLIIAAIGCYLAVEGWRIRRLDDARQWLPEGRPFELLAARDQRVLNLRVELPDEAAMPSLSLAPAGRPGRAALARRRSWLGS